MRIVFCLVLTRAENPLISVSVYIFLILTTRKYLVFRFQLLYVRKSKRVLLSQHTSHAWGMRHEMHNGGNFTEKLILCWSVTILVFKIKLDPFVVRKGFVAHLSSLIFSVPPRTGLSFQGAYNYISSPLWLRFCFLFMLY